MARLSSIPRILIVTVTLFSLALLPATNPVEAAPTTNDPAIVGLSLGAEQEYWAYLPVIANTYYSWYQYDLGEPNDTPDQAYGPLNAGQTYQAYIWDQTDLSDYYYWIPPKDGAVQICVTDIAEGADYDLYIYQNEGGQHELVVWSNNSGSGDDCVTFAPVPGRRYYIRVYPFKGHSSEHPYQLKITYR